jgi:hypothetical protein
MFDIQLRLFLNFLLSGSALPMSSQVPDPRSSSLLIQVPVIQNRFRNSLLIDSDALISFLEKMVCSFFIPTRSSLFAFGKILSGKNRFMNLEIYYPLSSGTEFLLLSSFG